MPSVVIPAHNEERVLGRLLAALVGDTARDQGERMNVGSGELEVVVVANGCDDATADVARRHPAVRVLETPVASKSHALRLGDAAAASFPRLYLDADVVIGSTDVDELCRVLAQPGVLAAGPERDLPMRGSALLVRWYYDVWSRLPVVRNELFGRGVIAVNEAGHARLAPFFAASEEIMADDLAMALAFGDHERRVVVAARVEIRPPRTYADLMRRRVRAMTGNALLTVDERGGERPHTGLGDVFRLVVREPGIVEKVRLAPKAGVLVATAMVSRLLARRAIRERDSAWLRDESSRTDG